MSDLTDALKRWDKHPGLALADDPDLFVAAARRWAAVREAITNEGSHPSFHRKVMRKHKEEWPTLWAALE